MRKLHLPVDISLELFNQLVTPILLYGSEVWGFSNLEQIEVLYRKFIKTILFVKPSTPNSMIYGETGSMPIINTVISRMVIFFARIVNGKQSKLSAMMYNLSRKKHYSDDEYFSDWIHTLENTLSHLGMYDIWLFQGNGFCTNIIKNRVKRKILDTYMQEWSAEVQMHDFCDLYQYFKTNSNLEKYLIELTFYQRLILTKWRLRSNNLPISKTRFELNDDVVCPFCPDYIGDEIHYLFVCKFFDEDREKYCPELLHCNNHRVYLYNIFNGQNRNVLYKIIPLLDLIMKIFTHEKEWISNLDISID